MSGMRILWVSNAPHVGSGYGIQANSLLPRLAKHPSIEEIGIFGYYGIQGGLCELPVGLNIPGIEATTMMHYPVTSKDGWGNDVVAEHAEHFGADVVITLLDVWVFKQNYGHQGFYWLPYAPVDHDPIPPKVLRRLRDGYHALAYSKHAAGEYAKNGLDHHYIPHGVETKIFKPYDGGGKLQAKKYLGFEEDNFVIGIVAANRGWPSRKGFPELMEAFSIFHKDHPDARLFAHTDTTDQSHNGIELNLMAEMYGIGDYTRFSLPYVNLLGLTSKEMCRLYNGMDVFCLPSMGEGFGIPIIEAQACGVPVIVSDWTACAELCGAGLRVPMAKKIPTPLGSFQAYADVGALVKAMEAMYTVWKSDTREYERLRDAAREFAMQYDWETLVEDHWNPFIDWLWERVEVKTMQRTFRTDGTGSGTPKRIKEYA